MIEVDIKINPYGSDENVHTIGNVYIANIGEGYGYGNMNYFYMIYEPKSRFSEEVSVHGIISNHNPVQACSKLLQAVMKDYGESACELSEKYASIWLSERGDGDESPFCRI